MQQDADPSISTVPLEYAAPVRRLNRVANIVVWCCFYALGAVVLITWFRFTTLVILDYRVLQFCVLAFVVTAVLHATGHRWRFVAALAFFLVFAASLFYETSIHVMQLAGMVKGGDFLLWLVVPIELTQLIAASIGLGVALRHRVWRSVSAAA